MNRSLLLLLLVHSVAVSCFANEPVSERWRDAYAGKDSSGAHVIGHWHLDAGEVTKDSGPHALAGRLDGAVALADGKFGGAIESFPGWPVEDKHHALVVSNHRALSPHGAFTVEMWVQPKPDFAESASVYLLDKKYASHNDYQWQLSAANPAGARFMTVNLGFGTDSESFSSDRIEFTPGQWYHIAFSYDGAGTVRFFRDGSTVGIATRPGRRGVSAGTHTLSVGDRVGSYYGGFPGLIDEVRICEGSLEFNPASIRFDVERTAWVRRESPPTISLAVRNLQSQTLRGAKLTWSGIGPSPASVNLPAVEPGDTHVVSVPFDTSLRPDEYELRARVRVPAEPPVDCVETLSLQIVPRSADNRMPVVMWGIGGPDAFDRELPRLKALGFTHCLGLGADYDTIWNEGKPMPTDTPTRIAANRRMLDKALANNLRIAAALHPGYFLKKRPELARVDRDGKPWSRNDCNAALPGLAEFCGRVGTSVAETYGRHPAFAAALVNSEVRDDSQVSFSKFDRDAYREHSGRDIPDAIAIKNGVLWRDLDDFPADRIIPDNHPILEYYRWFWTDGDGWNNLHSSLNGGLKSTGRDDIWTWYDPAIRVPSVGGSGGDVDVLSQWTYTEPSPLRVGYYCDEVFAMADASSRAQRVMKMTQLFWYRSSSAPLKTGSEFIASPFDDHDPDAAYISIAPMHLRGAFWSMISRPVTGLMYHGWSSLVPTDGTHAYKYTQPDLKTEFQRLHREILQPLGPALLRLPDRQSDVAYLNSFTSQMFARRGSYGYSHDEAYLTLLHAQLQPQVIFEETLLARGLDAYKVLVLVDCDVLTSSVAAQIKKFQQRGGIIVGDPNLAPAIQPDIVLPRFRRTKKTDSDKKEILSNAAKLREELDRRYKRYADCSNPEIVTRVRTAGQCDYVFVVNDHREFGTYVGQHGLVMEHGLPSDGRLRLRRDGVHVYDLLNQRNVFAKDQDNLTTWPVSLSPCDGQLFLVTPHAIEQLHITAPPSIRRGETARVAIRITDAQGRVVPAVIPLEVWVTDPNGRQAEPSGYHACSDGVLTLELDPASNDTPGVWQIKVHESASGLIATRHFRVEP